MIYIGIDPGASGGMAVLDDQSKDAVPMPATEKDVCDWFVGPGPFGSDSIAEQHCFACIEKVGGFIAGNPAPGSAMFKFGQSYGFLRGCLTAAGIPFEEVTPQRWQKGLGIAKRGKNESKGQFKARLKQKASQLFPEVKVTLATADALLIAEFIRRKRTGTL